MPKHSIWLRIHDLSELFAKIRSSWLRFTIVTQKTATQGPSENVPDYEPQVDLFLSYLVGVTIENLSHIKAFSMKLSAIWVQSSYGQPDMMHVTDLSRDGAKPNCVSSHAACLR